MDEPCLVIKPDAKHLRRIVLISVVVLAVLIWTRSIETADPLSTDAMASVLLWLFPPLVLYEVYRMWSGQPLLTIDPQGIFVHGWLGLPTVVGWGEVHDIYTYRVFGQEYLGIKLRDPMTMPQRHNALRRAMMRLASVGGHAHVKVSALFLPVTLEEVRDWILEHYGGWVPAYVPGETSQTTAD